MKYVPCVLSYSNTIKVRCVAWSPDGTHLIAVTTGGSVIEVTNNNAHSTVYKINKGLRIMLTARSLLTLYLSCGGARSVPVGSLLSEGMITQSHSWIHQTTIQLLRN